MPTLQKLQLVAESHDAQFSGQSIQIESKTAAISLEMFCILARVTGVYLFNSAMSAV